MAADYSERQVIKILLEPEVAAITGMKVGDTAASAWDCDLTFDYVETNADYRL